jgi:hypothetical protein
MQCAARGLVAVADAGGAMLLTMVLWVVITFERYGRMGGRRNGWMAGWVGWVGGWRDGWAVCEVWVDRWASLRVGFININDMYNNDVGKGGAQGCEAYEVK